MSLIGRAAEAVIAASPVPPHPQVAEHIARAVLLAIREPSEEMVEAGRREMGDCFGYERQAAEAGYQAMLDKLLEEGT